MELVVTSGAIRCANFQSNHHYQLTNPSCHPTNMSKHWRQKLSHSMDFLWQAQLGVFLTCLWPLKAPGDLGESCQASRQPNLSAFQYSAKYLCNIIHCDIISSCVFVRCGGTKMWQVQKGRKSTEMQNRCLSMLQWMWTVLAIRWKTDQVMEEWQRCMENCCMRRICGTLTHLPPQILWKGRGSCELFSRDEKLMEPRKWWTKVNQLTVSESPRKWLWLMKISAWNGDCTV